MRKTVIFLAMWIALLLLGNVTCSLYRHEQFEEHLESNIAVLREEKEISLQNLEDEWNSLDTRNPEEVLHYLKFEIGPYYYDYLINFNEYLKEKPRGNLLIGTFITQADEGALLEGYFIIRVLYSGEVYNWHDESEHGRMLLEYCHRYEDKNQGFAWEEFKKSDEFKQFLNEFCIFVENKEDISLQETYQQVMNLEKVDTTNIYRKALLQSYTYLAEICYNNYQVHKENDFMKTFFDAEVVYSVHGFSQYWETKETAFNTLVPFQRHIIYAHSSIQDIKSVFTFSTGIAVAIWIILYELEKKD
ncbi:MAG: hypothetical protein HXS44_07720 [Theionarchaea archaeon]|nr:hypothetical protein [Theionarchaea archaeon]